MKILDVVITSMYARQQQIKNTVARLVEMQCSKRKCVSERKSKPYNKKGHCAIGTTPMTQWPFQIMN
ncbi:hypothetical protein A4W77_09450 (plasmid) [Latilactobacillus curvatus]|nr:hypothetical protein A4W77_09450 [Latilactobacillus curvatus]